MIFIKNMSLRYLLRTRLLDIYYEYATMIFIKKMSL